MLQRLMALANLGIAGFYSYSVIQHLLRPGDNTGYTRMLLFACFASIPMIFMMVMVGGHDRWPALLQLVKVVQGQGAIGWFALVGIIFVVVLMPLGFLLMLWHSLGLKFGGLFLLYFLPFFIRLFFSSAKESTQLALQQILLYFGAFFAAMAVMAVLQGMNVDTLAFQDNMHAVWPKTRSSTLDSNNTDGIYFFGICLFALANQVIEFWRAARSLLMKISW
jgi:hypothetical protein